MNIVSIDPSLTSTAMIVNDKKFIYTSEGNIFTKKGVMKKWYEEMDDLITYRIHPDLPELPDHSALEVFKLTHFLSISRKIYDDITNNIDLTEPTRVGIEGYSYSSDAGPLIDLVTLSTLIRIQVTLFITPAAILEIYQPTQLKMKAAQFTYPAIPKNKAETKFEWRNHQGVAGGSFKKHEIYKALIENPTLKCPYVERIRSLWPDIEGVKAVPKPIEDMNDAKILYEIMSKPNPLL